MPDDNRNAPALPAQKILAALLRTLATHRQPLAALYDDGVHPTIKDFVRAAQNPLDTTTAPLVQTVLGPIVDALRPALVFNAIPGTVPVPADLGQNAIRFPTLTTGMTGGFVAEGAPIPVSEGVFGSVTVPAPSKAAGLAVLTEELRRAPGGLEFVGSALLGSCAQAINKAFLSNGAASGATPAGILNGVTPIAPSAAATADAKMLADVMACWSALAAANADPSGLAWIVHPSVFGKLASGTTFPSVAANGTLLGAPIIQSSACDVSGNAGGASAINDLILVNGAAMFIGVGIDPSGFSVSADASIHMESAPAADIGGGGSATPVRGLWQSDMLAARAVATSRWAKRPAGAVAWVDAIGW
jgi:hypothetical protein